MRQESPTIASKYGAAETWIVSNSVLRDRKLQLFGISYPADTLFIYHQASSVLGSKTHVLAYDVAIEKLLDRQDDQPLVIVNLAAGLRTLELEGWLPGAAAASNAAVFPSGCQANLVCDDKLLMKSLAAQAGFLVPGLLHSNSANADGIVKPIAGTDSIGISRIEFKTGMVPPVGHFFEEFIGGADATIHLVNIDGHLKITEFKYIEFKECEFLDREKKADANLIFQNSESAHDRSIVDDLDIIVKYQDLIDRLFQIIPSVLIARIDLRIPNAERLEEGYFLELNAIPTVSNANTWRASASVLAKAFNPELWRELQRQPIHEAAKSIALFLEYFYVQSLSMQMLNPVSR